MFYKNVQTWGNTVFHRASINGKDSIRREKGFRPRYWVPAQRGEESEWTTIKGHPVTEIQCDSIKAGKEFLEMNRNVDNSSVYGDIQPKYKYIAEKYPDEISYDISDIVICYLDIETAKTSDGDFPSAELGNAAILTIALNFTNFTKKVILGLKEYSPKEDEFYVQCETEEALLNKFLNIWKSNWPDIVSGWFIEGFDIPFLIHRIERVLGEKESNRLSPFGVVQTRQSKGNFGQDETLYTIYGMSILDYLALYKKFTYTGQESYTLNYIAEIELGENKVDYSHIGTLHELYDKDFQLFVEYNMKDVDLVVRLEEKLRFIELVVSVALLAKVNFEDVFSPIRIWTVLIYNYLLTQQKVTPQNTRHTSRSYEGAYVKVPVIGKYENVISYDVVSLYPSIIRMLNLGVETKREIYSAITPDRLASKDNTNIQNEIIDKGVSIAANGVTYDKSKISFFSYLIENLFNLRIRTKKEAKKVQAEIQNTTDKSIIASLKSKYAALNAKQMAVKILINAQYGACGAPYFTYYDPDNAEAITLTGQYIIQYIERHCNEMLNNFFSTSDVEYCIYCDTDSVYMNLNQLIQNQKSPLTVEERVNLLDDFCKKEMTPYIDSLCERVVQEMNGIPHIISMARDVIAPSGIWMSKKRYILDVWDSEGVRYSEPQIKMMGVEAIKSSTPTIARTKLKDAIKIALRGTEAEMRKFIRDLRNEYSNLRIEDIAFPKSANNLGDFQLGKGWRKGTPIHVKGALLFNRLIEERNLHHKYQRISSGEKVKYTYLKMPNPIHEPIISFVGELPPELELRPFVDFKTQFEKGFLSPLQSILENIGWSEHEQISIEDLLS